MSEPGPTAAAPEFSLLIDGGCPLCAREAGLLRRLDRGRGLLALVDITAPDFDPADIGTTFQTLMSEMHGLTPDGQLVAGVEAFRRAYGAVGWGWVLAPTAWPGLRFVSDRLYAWFARNRRRMTGRCDRADGTCTKPR